MGESNDLFDRILNHGPSQGTLFLILTRMKEEGRFSEVIRESLKGLSFYPDDIRLRHLLAECYLEDGAIDLAEKELESVASGIKELISVYKLQAEIFGRQDRAEKASEALRLYLAHNPDDQEALDLLKPTPEPPVIPEDIGPSVEEEFEEEVIEETITEVPEAPGDIVFAAEEVIEEKPLPDVSEIPEDVALAKEEEIEEGIVSDLATPTLAEIYYNQGQINDAISTYENILLKNPDDQASRERLAELKASIAEDSRPPVAEEDELKARTKKMITILEGWLERIHESNHA